MYEKSQSDQPLKVEIVPHGEYKPIALETTCPVPEIAKMHYTSQY